MTLTTTIAAAIHEACKERWAIAAGHQQHFPDAHRETAERVAAALAPLVAAVPEDPYYQDGMGAFCFWCDKGAGRDRTHKTDCPWLAARALLEGREP